MTEVLQANIFFFITSASVIAFTVLLCVAVFYIIKILRTISRITERVDEKSELIAEDFKRFRDQMAEKSLVSHIIGLFALFGKNKSRRRTKSVDEDELE